MSSTQSFVMLLSNPKLATDFVVQTKALARQHEIDKQLKASRSGRLH